MMSCFSYITQRRGKATLFRMSSFPWLALAVLTALVFTALAARAAMPARAPEQAGDGGGDASGAPLAPLQRAAWWTLGAGVAFVAAVVALILRHGVAAWWEEASVRLPVTALMLGALIACLAPMIVARRRVTARGVAVDERDLEILARAPRVQGASVLVCLALWTAALMEAFRAPGQVPTAFLALECWSCLLVYSLALPVGILLGYRRR